MYHLVYNNLDLGSLLPMDVFIVWCVVLFIFLFYLFQVKMKAGGGSSSGESAGLVVQVSNAPPSFLWVLLTIFLVFFFTLPETRWISSYKRWRFSFRVFSTVWAVVMESSAVPEARSEAGTGDCLCPLRHRPLLQRGLSGTCHPGYPTSRVPLRYRTGLRKYYFFSQ